MCCFTLSKALPPPPVPLHLQAGRRPLWQVLWGSCTMKKQTLWRLSSNEKVVVTEPGTPAPLAWVRCTPLGVPVCLRLSLSSTRPEAPRALPARLARAQTLSRMKG